MGVRSNIEANFDFEIVDEFLAVDTRTQVVNYIFKFRFSDVKDVPRAVIRALVAKAVVESKNLDNVMHKVRQSLEKLAKYGELV